MKVGEMGCEEMLCRLVYGMHTPKLLSVLRDTLHLQASGEEHGLKKGGLQRDRKLQGDHSSGDALIWRCLYKNK